MELIKNGKFIALTYELFIPDDEEQGEELMEGMDKTNPLKFVSGAGMMLSSFEAKIEGMKAGDKFDFELSPEEAYGEYSEEAVMDLPRNIFEVNGEFDEEMITVGNIIPMMDSEGNKHNALVMEVGTEVISLDFNHPLAGEPLHFMGEIIEVREATEEDMETGCGGNCGDGCGDCNSGGCCGG